MKQNINIDLLKTILNNLPDALILIDPELKVKFSNSQFDVLFGSSKNSSFDQLLGESIKCRDFAHNASNQPHKCKHCKLLVSVTDAFESKQNQMSDSVVLHIKQDDIEELRLIQFQANYFEFEDDDFVLLKLNDFSELGQETYDLLSKIKKEI